MSDVLFEVRDENLETGLRGMPVGYCTTSSADPQKGLHYVGRPVSSLASWEPENVIYLLYYGKEGSPEEVEKFSAELKRRATCSPKTIKHIRLLPRQGHPMRLYVCALMICGMIEGKKDYEEDCLDVIAKVPELVANLINYHAGWPDANPSNPELGYMENFAQMLNVPNGNLESLTRVFKLFNVLHYDHGGGNLSAFVGKAVASGLQDMYGSLAAAMSALTGARHGMANQDCLAFVQEVLDALGPDATEEQLRSFIEERLKQHKLIYGFGHAVLRVEDPRATVFYELAQREYSDNPLVKIALLLRTVVPQILKAESRVADPYPNVDAISGTVLVAVGFPYPEYFTVLFGLARVIGIARQIMYERTEAHEGKGTPIMRPKYIYKPIVKESGE